MGFTFKVVMEVEPYLSAPAPSDDRGQGTVRVPAGRLNSSLKFRAGGRRGDGRGNDRGDALGIQPEVGCRDQGGPLGVSQAPITSHARHAFERPPIVA